jgi:hypothetical protein
VPDERLQDYVDGRLAENERAEIEVLLEEDAELARRVEGWREIGRALRDETVDLPPGFHARARERFERSRRGRAPWGFRLLTWEAAGLAAAVLLVGAIFVPGATILWRGGALPDSPPRIEEAGEERMEEPVLESAPRQEGADTPADALKKTESAPSAGRDKGRVAVPEPAWAPVPQDAPAEGMEPEAAADEVRREPRPAPPPARARHAPAPSVDAARIEEAPRAPAAKREKEDKGSRAPAFGFLEEDADASAVGSGRLADLVVIALPPGVVVQEGIEVVEDRATWNAWLSGPAGGALSALGGFDPAQRLVLVGRGDGIDCASLEVRDVRDGYRVRTAPAGEHSGCAFVLPRDGRGVRLEERSVE